MTMINPVTQKVYVHFGDVPVGGQLLCGKLCSEQMMMMMTTRLSQVTCPDCIIEDRSPIELNEQMQVLKGWKRIDAARELGLKHTPCVVHLPTGDRSLDGVYVLGEEQSLDRIRFAVISNNTVEYQYLEVQAKRFCDICDEFLKGDESVGIGPHEERECEEMLDSIMSEFVANTVTFFGSDLPDSFLEASLTRVLSNDKLGPGWTARIPRGEVVATEERMADLNGHAPFRTHEVGTDSWCRGCGLTMKAREWPAFAAQEKGKGIPPCKGDA